MEFFLIKVLSIKNILKYLKDTNKNFVNTTLIRKTVIIQRIEKQDQDVIINLKRNLVM